MPAWVEKAARLSGVAGTMVASATPSASTIPTCPNHVGAAAIPVPVPVPSRVAAFPIPSCTDATACMSTCSTVAIPPSRKKHPDDTHDGGATMASSEGKAAATSEAGVTVAAMAEAASARFGGSLPHPRRRRPLPRPRPQLSWRRPRPQPRHRAVLCICNGEEEERDEIG
ncbi:hypothetical protein DAI22_01g073508 [Oryza sativa Japonica Group]|nr:hypothetical protein DAI22_01g073508 [Oryza sativa Japonica Group]